METGFLKVTEPESVSPIQRKSTSKEIQPPKRPSLVDQATIQNSTTIQENSEELKFVPTSTKELAILDQHKSEEKSGLIKLPTNSNS